MWMPTIQEFKELFANNYILDVLSILSAKNDKSITPMELSDLLEIHVTTAKKYLELLTKYDFTSKIILKNKLGRPSVYTLIKETIEIKFSLTNNFLEDDLILDIWNPVIRESVNIDEIAEYRFDSDILVNEIKVKIRTKAKKDIPIILKLDKNESLFMKYLPPPQSDPKSLIKICNSANISSNIDMKLIENFARKLLKYKLIENVLE